MKARTLCVFVPVFNKLQTVDRCFEALPEYEHNYGKGSALRSASPHVEADHYII